MGKPCFLTPAHSWMEWGEVPPAAARVPRFGPVSGLTLRVLQPGWFAFPSVDSGMVNNRSALTVAGAAQALKMNFVPVSRFTPYQGAPEAGGSLTQV